MGLFLLQSCFHQEIVAPCSNFAGVHLYLYVYQDHGHETLEDVLVSFPLLVRVYLYYGNISYIATQSLLLLGRGGNEQWSTFNYVALAIFSLLQRDPLQTTTLNQGVAFGKGSFGNRNNWWKKKKRQKKKKRTKLCLFKIGLLRME